MTMGSLYSDKILKPKNLLAVYLLIYTGINLLYLSSFPLVHSDEAWLAGLSRRIILEVDLSSTEPFFDLFPRNPHALRILFHLLQIPFVIFAYTPFSIRLLSLIFGIASLLLFYRLVGTYLSDKTSLFITLLFSLDIQFIYASHFGRQEIILLFFMLWGLFYLLSKPMNLRKVTFFASIPGFAIGFHPNAFIIFLVLFPAFLFRLRRMEKPFLALAIFSGTLLLWAGLFIGISLVMDPDFFNHYRALGEEYNVTASPAMKLREFIPFYGRIFLKISGTYYLPDLRIQLILFPVFLFLNILILFSRHKSNDLNQLALLGVVGINLGILFLGKYSQPSILFIIPFLYISLAGWIGKVPVNIKKPLLLLLFIILGVSSSLQIMPYRTNRYREYTDNIARFISPEAPVLANLNTGFYFSDGALLDYRNLPFLRDKNISLTDYIYERKIQYLFLTDELDFIYRNRPVWNGLYGNPYTFYPELIDYIENHCDLIGSFNDPYYGTRITRYQGKENWKTYIYRVRGSISE